MTDDLRARIAAVAQHCREHKPEHECVCSMPPTDWDYELADAVIRELNLEPQDHYDPDCPYYRYVTDWVLLADDTTGDVNHD